MGFLVFYEGHTSKIRDCPQISGSPDHPISKRKLQIYIKLAFFPLKQLESQS